MPEYLTLMTWCALHGGLSLALAMSTSSFLDSDVYWVLINSVYIIIFFTVVIQGLTVKTAYTKLENHKQKRLATKN